MRENRARRAGSRAKSFSGLIPVFLGRSIGTPSVKPELIRQGFDLLMSKQDDAVLVGGFSVRLVTVTVGARRMLESFSGVLPPSLVDLFILILSGSPMSLDRYIRRF